ncbi:hypothetical protein ABZW11_41715 [Nonomuraea sp. NPDC004580]|uniref:hypothetical protein n=1 Tax=Nonomuraea sp. NPDC004580 TaxID=3154552 RepID=UPI0033A0F2D1
MRSTTSLDELSEELHLSSAAPLSEEEVRGLEDLVQAPLPDEFRSFLRRFGLGAHPGLVIDPHRRQARAGDDAPPRPPLLDRYIGWTRPLV